MFKDKIKLLGAFGGKTSKNNNTCVQINEKILIDAGNILNSLGKHAAKVEHIFLTHSHLDHITDIPFLLDQFFDKRETPLKIYGLSETIDNLQKHILNWNIWPDFTQINMLNKDKPSIILKKINLDDEIQIDDVILKPLETNHTVPSCGYIITKNKSSLLFASDTYRCPLIWETINKRKDIKSLIIDVSFPSRFEELSYLSKHLTPKKLKEELDFLQREDLTIYINHIKPMHFEEVAKEVKEYDYLNGGKILVDNDIINIETQRYESESTNNSKNHVNQLIEIGHSLTSEKDINILFEKILLGAKNLSNADAGTLYLLTDDKKLEFKVVQTDSLNIKMGGTGDNISWDKLNLYGEDGSSNKEMVAALCAIENKLINIDDVYFAEGFNFNGTKAFDKNTGYRSKSMLVIPMTNYENEVIGVIQLLNKQDVYNNSISFNKKDEKLIKSMASQAAISIENNRLIEEMEKLFDSFIRTIGLAIGEKSVYTGGHIRRVASLASIFSNAINDDRTVYDTVNYSEDDLREIEVASWLHDIGKITTPEQIIDKATKLETIYDRINTIKTRFEVVKRDLELNLYKKLPTLNNKEKILEEEKFKEEIDSLDEHLAFITKINYGAYMSDENKQRVKDISQIKLTLAGEEINLLNENEVYNLCIQRGTLTEEEREIINNHVVVTYNMLKTLPFPKKLKRVPVIAGSHHKKVIGGGYGAQEIMDLPMTIEDKMLAIVDVFEALTANDRPYKKANSLNKSMNILAAMVKEGALDKELVQFFVNKGLHFEYAKRYLNDEQMDEITVDFDDL